LADNRRVMTDNKQCLPIDIGRTDKHKKNKQNSGHHRAGHRKDRRQYNNGRQPLAFFEAPSYFIKQVATRNQPLSDFSTHCNIVTIIVGTTFFPYG